MDIFMDFFNKPSVTETFVDVLLCAVPIWVAVMIGLLIGWSWRPRWTGLVYLGFRSKLRFLLTAPPGFGARRIWLAFTALSVFSVCRTLWSRLGSSSKKLSVSGSAPSSKPVGEEEEESFSRASDKITDKEQDVVTEKDLEHLLYLLEAGNANLEWQSMMDKSTPNMSYQAWRHEPETGPVVYRSRTVFEDATPDIVRDFFWDDEFRPKWDPMLAYFKTLEEDPKTGTTIVHWIKKFPFFCSDREYIIGRRIWESGKKYYAVTKGVPYQALPKRDKPRRVELYFSSWIIKAVESRKGDGQMTACEVSLVHYEDMGIPKDVAKLGVRHGMWGAVKKLNSGLRAYQSARKPGTSLSRSAQIASITTKLNMDLVETSVAEEEERGRAVENARKQKDQFSVDWKWIVVGGVALACGLHSSAIGKALMVGAGQRLARR
ncbi:START domain [Arabidopsis thaliana x Arabidopsis arenosa]|uniref:START domain n=1 Tax=Arabidopsis thaliana x Arabidopsis arenosa TaxID=1240361 RepID=A0A8T2AXL0_9BRAS|nr:START domain [Arabidopsis thaliana x Arabidopsis arenosa]